MPKPTYDYGSKDPMAMPVEAIESSDFDYARYEAFAAEADARYAAWLEREEGVAVWQRVRPGEVFREGCRDMRASYRWQLGALQKSLDYITDAPTYLEPWYGIGTIASAFGADYIWHPGQAPAVKPIYTSLDGFEQFEALPFTASAILRYTRETVDYFLHESGGRIPMSWCDIQAPINVAGGLIDIGTFFMDFYQDPNKIKALLASITETLIRYYQEQGQLIGKALAQPGHGFASSRLGTGIGLSTDNLVMVSPKMYQQFCGPGEVRIGEAFGGVAIHSCGDWFKWLDMVKKTPNLTMVDGGWRLQPSDRSCLQQLRAISRHLNRCGRRFACAYGRRCG